MRSYTVIIINALLETEKILIFSFSGNPNRSNPGISKSFFINESI